MTFAPPTETNPPFSSPPTWPYPTSAADWEPDYRLRLLEAAIVYVWAHGTLVPPATLTGTNPATTPLTVQGAPSQTANVFAVQTNGGGNLLSVSNTGNVIIAGTLNAGNTSISGSLITTHNTLDDGSGNATVSGTFTATGGIQNTNISGGTITNATLNNIRIQKRVVNVTQSATPAINTNNTDVANITGLAQAITSMTTNLSGVPNSFDSLIIAITDNGTARAITWGASFESSTVSLPTTTTANAMLMVGFFWNAVTSKWRCVAVA